MNKRTTCAILGALFALAGCHSTSVQDQQGNKLTLLKPADQTLRRGDTNQVTVAINRGGFTSPVPIDFAGLPAGVRVVEADRKIQSGESSASFTLQADNNAALVEKQRVVVTAYTPGGAETREEFRVTVKETR
jgi:hypothetical protein